MRTSFAYCPRPSWRARLAYALGRDLLALPVYAFACLAAGGAAGMLLFGVLRLSGLVR